MKKKKNIAGKKRCVAFFMAAAMGTGSVMGSNMGMQLPSTVQRLLLENEVVTVQAASKPSAKKLASAVKKVYGEDYVLDQELDESRINKQYGVSSSWYSSAFAAEPTIGVHADELAIFKAKNKESGKKILKALKRYQKKLKENTMDYPMNLPKVQASRLYKNGDYVCFMILGRISSQLEENGSEEDMIKAYQKQNNKAVKAIKKQLK